MLDDCAVVQRRGWADILDEESGHFLFGRGYFFSLYFCFFLSFLFSLTVAFYGFSIDGSKIRVTTI